MRIILYPKGFDPAVAAGPPSKEYLDSGVTWTEEDTDFCQLLAALAQVIEVEHPPQLQWYREVRSSQVFG